MLIGSFSGQGRAPFLGDPYLNSTTVLFYTGQYTYITCSLKINSKFPSPQLLIIYLLKLNDHPIGCITVNTSLNGLDTDLIISSNETVSVVEQLLVVAELLRRSDLSNKKAANKKSMVALQQTFIKISYFGIEGNNYYSYLWHVNVWGFLTEL